MIERQIDSPMPISSDFVVKKGWKIRFMVPASIPRSRVFHRDEHAAGSMRSGFYAQHARPVRDRAHCMVVSFRQERLQARFRGLGYIAALAFEHVKSPP
jgi:hypothetical protein